MVDLKNLIQSLDREGILGYKPPVIEKIVKAKEEVQVEPEIEQELSIEMPVQEEVLLTDEDFQEIENPRAISEDDMLNKIYIEIDKLKNQMSSLINEMRQGGKASGAYQKVSALPPQQGGTITPAIVGGTQAFNKYVKFGEDAEQVYASMGVDQAYDSLDAGEAPTHRMNMNVGIKPIPKEAYRGMQFPESVSNRALTANAPLPTPQQRSQIYSAPPIKNVLPPQAQRPVGVPPPIPKVASQTPLDFDFLDEVS